MPTLRLLGDTKVRSLPSIWIFPECRQLKPGNHAQGRGLTTTAWSQERDEFTLLCTQVEIVHCNRFCKFFIYVR